MPETAGLPNTRAVPAGVSAVQRDGTLEPISNTLMPPAAAPGSAPPPEGVVGATPGLQVAAVSGPPAQGGGGGFGGTAAVVGGVLGGVLAVAVTGAVLDPSRGSEGQGLTPAFAVAGAHELLYCEARLAWL